MPHAKDDDGYYHCFQEIEQLVRGRLAGEPAATRRTPPPPDD
ncbi:hypothetical protein [Mycobacterium avium]|nr:hypothetical protein [Mycobacterium avium]